MKAQVIALVDRKDGVGESTSRVDLGVGLAQPDTLPVTLSNVMGEILTDQPIAPGEGIQHYPEGETLCCRTSSSPAWRCRW